MAKRKTGREKKIAVILAIAILLGVVSFIWLGVRLTSKAGVLDKIQLPSGFKIEILADNLGGSPVSYPGPNPGLRMMLLRGDALFVTIPSQGKVVAIPYTGGNKAGAASTFIDGLNNPHGIDFHDGWFYIAEENRVIRVKEGGNLTADRDTLQVLVGDFPTGGHFTRTLKIYNNSMYVSIGSSCNVCQESDERRATIMKCGLDGTGCRVFARGLRNAVGFVFHPETGKIYATENGRDNLGEDIPPDEINLVEDGRNYGWPICYGKNVHDTDFDKNVYVRNPCMEPFETPSLVDLQAHSAPLGLAFYYGKSFPEGYKGKLFVAYHGSWNRKVPTGYKIVTIDVDSGEVRDFATGWLQGSTVIGRPVDIVVGKDGSLLVSDDNAGRIYRIYYAG